MEKGNGCAMIFILFVALCFFVGILGSLGVSRERHETKIEQELIAFKDGQSIKGEFFLGCGTIESVNYYFMYTRNSDGEIKQSRVEVDKAVIYEEDRKNGFLEIYETRNGYGVLVEQLTKYVIRVPKDTVIRQFTADLE